MGWRGVRGTAAFLLALVFAMPVHAFDLGRLFSGGAAAPVAPSPESLPYQLRIEGLAGEDGIEEAIDENSVLKRLASEPPVDGLDLVRRAEADVPKFIDLLWGQGYYAAKVVIEVAGQRLSADGSGQWLAAKAAERFKASALVPVRVIIESGPRYAFSRVEVVAATGETVPAHLYDRLAGAPAQSPALVAAAGRISAYFRQNGHPYVSMDDPEAVIDHRNRSVAVTLEVKPGPRARLGAIHVEVPEGIDAGVIRSHIYSDNDLMFSPERLADIRRSVGRIEAVGSVRVLPRTKLDPDGTVPIDVQVTERPRHVLGGTVRYSNVDGPGLSLYWADRNLFGGAERLRLGGDLFYLPSSFSRNGNSRFDTNNIGGRLEASFLKPALYASRVDFLANAMVDRTATEAYVSRLANITTGLRYRFADKTWVQAGLMGEAGQVYDVFGRQNYRLLGLPLSGNLDTTDNELDPTRGFRLSGSLMPALGFGDIGRTLVVGKMQASAYQALDEDQRVIIAGRVAVGSISGGAIDRIPANWRFFAGGGGSVRGYEYRSLGPRDGYQRLVGGRSLFEASLEARFRVTETIGIVPFVDAGTAFESTVPTFDRPLRWGVGLGLRYHTAIGPIRFDVAVPLDRQRGEQPVAFYISLGQAF